MITSVVSAVCLVCAWVASLAPAAPPDPTATPADPELRAVAPPALLLVDDRTPPRVEVSWPRQDGSKASFEARLPYASPTQKAPIGANLAAYVGVGGTRIDRGQGHPQGLTVRVGLYKVDANEPFFDGIAVGASVRVRLEGVRLNQPAYPVPGTMLQHVQFTAAELEACNLGDASLNLYHTADPADTHTGRLTDDDSRRGVLRVAGYETEEPAFADASLLAPVRLEREGPDVFTLDAELPYGLLRHIADPWRITTPGTFQEPSHFHLEVEVLPEGVEPKPVNTGRPAPPRERIEPREAAREAAKRSADEDAGDSADDPRTGAPTDPSPNG